MKTTQILKKCSFILIAMFMAWAWANIASAADLWQENPSLKQENKRTMGWENSSLESEAMNYMPADAYYTRQTSTNTQAGENINASSVDRLVPAIPSAINDTTGSPLLGQDGLPGTTGNPIMNATMTPPVIPGFPAFAPPIMPVTTATEPGAGAGPSIEMSIRPSDAAPTVASVRAEVAPQVNPNDPGK